MKPPLLILRLLQIVCISSLLVSVLLFAFAIPSRFEQLNRLTPELNILSGALTATEAGLLSSLGLSLSFYAAYVTALESLTSFGGLLIGGIILWRKRDDAIALGVSLALMTLGTFPTPLMTSVVDRQPLLAPVVTFLQFVGIGPAMLVFYLFPDGRFVPHWSKWFAFVWVGYSIAWLVYPPLKPPLSIFAIQASPPLLNLLAVGTLGVGIYSQIYRYRYVSTPVQRQQGKWIVFGFCTNMTILMGFGLSAAFFDLNQLTTETMLFLLVAIAAILLGLFLAPLTVMISILQYRLWDIDILIRRTLLYSVLTGLLALTYLGGVILLQTAFQTLLGAGDSPLVTVLSTLAIAALFFPLRTLVQDFIDRRFYRRKYDAQKVLAEFATTARDETDLDTLAARLVQVADDTMQPESLSVWLKGTRG